MYLITKKYNSLITKKIYFITLLTIFLLTACEKKKVDKELYPLSFQTYLKYNNKKIATPPYLFQLSNKLSIKLETFKFYLSDVTFIDTNNKPYLFADIILFDLFNVKQNTFTGILLENNYQQLNFKIGVPENLNGTQQPNFDATIYPDTHPLSIYNNMYWTHALGYLFIKLEGKADTTHTAKFDQPFFYHVGTNKYLTEKTFKLQLEGSKPHTIQIIVDIDQLFDGVDIISNPLTHTTDHPDVANKIMQNFAKALQIE